MILERKLGCGQTQSRRGNTKTQIHREQQMIDRSDVSAKVLK